MARGEELDAILEEQISYYRDRASEYDEVYSRDGLYDRGETLNRKWFQELSLLDSAVEAFQPTGRVLEIACGTGWWTPRLARRATELVAVDASPEMIERARQRVTDPNVRFVEADIFHWQPDGRFDAVFFAFWLSHVPEPLFEDFWSKVRGAMAPNGRVFFADNLPPQPADPKVAALRRQTQPADLGEGTVIRRLKDGREYRIVKLHYPLDLLKQRLFELGWKVEMNTTGDFIYYGRGGPT